MSNKNRNLASNPKRVAIVLANPSTSTVTGWPVGFWWAELTHPYFHFTEAGYEVSIFSPDGGVVQGDAMSNPEDPSQWQADDVISRGYIHDTEFVKLLDTTGKVEDIDIASFDAILVAGGQSPMFSFEASTELHKKFVEFFEAGKVTAAMCHGTAVLRYARLTNGEMLVKGRTVTGFANVEEDFADEATWGFGALARGVNLQPWRIETELKLLGANYIQAGLWKGFAVRDGNLITGQQNFSGAETAQMIIEALGR